MNRRVEPFRRMPVLGGLCAAAVCMGMAGECQTTLPGGPVAGKTTAGRWTGTMHYKTAQWLSVASVPVEGRSEVYPDILEQTLEFEYDWTQEFGPDGLPLGGLMILGGAAAGPGATAAIHQPGQSHTFHFRYGNVGAQTEVTYGATIREATYSPTGSHVVIDLTQETSFACEDCYPHWDPLLGIMHVLDMWRKEAFTGTQTIDVVLSDDQLT